MIVLSYFGILALIPLLVEKDDQEVQWHAKHGLVLTVSWFVLFFVLNFIPVAGCFITPVLALAVMGIHIICIVKGIGGERFLIPGLSQFVEKF
jgi:uncharacterized membrane protein